MGDGGVKVKELLSSIRSPVPFYSSAQTGRNDGKTEGRQEDFSEAGNQHRKQTGRLCWWHPTPKC